MNWFKVWGLEEQAKAAYARLNAEGVWTSYAGLITGLKAEECLECGECEPECPQNIHIMDQLKETAKALGGK
jgi:predicted aldo/keto reductase-like oxidoreductase